MPGSLARIANLRAWRKVTGAGMTHVDGPAWRSDRQGIGSRAGRRHG